MVYNEAVQKYNVIPVDPHSMNQIFLISIKAKLSSPYPGFPQRSSLSIEINHQAHGWRMIGTG